MVLCKIITVHVLATVPTMELEDVRSESKWDNVRLAELLDKGKGKAVTQRANLYSLIDLLELRWVWDFS